MFHKQTDGQAEEAKEAEARSAKQIEEDLRTRLFSESELKEADIRPSIISELENNVKNTSDTKELLELTEAIVVARDTPFKKFENYKSKLRLHKLDIRSDKYLEQYENYKSSLNRLLAEVKLANIESLYKPSDFARSLKQVGGKPKKTKKSKRRNYKNGKKPRRKTTKRKRP